MLCARCGATNGETVPFCGNCGAALKKQSDTSTIFTMSGQPGVDNASGMDARPIDELPTAHVPSVSVSPDIAPAAHIPFSKEFSLELGQAFAPLAQSGSDVLAAAPLVQPVFTPQPIAPAGSQPGDPPFSSPNIADYPTRTSVPIPPVSTPSVTYPHGSEPAAGPVSSPPGGTGPSAPLARPGMLSLPSRPKTPAPSSQSGINTPPSQPVANPSSGGVTPPSHPGVTMSPSQPNMSAPPTRTTNPPSQPGMSGPPAGTINPPSQPGWQVGNARPGPAMPPVSGNMSRPPSQPGMYATPTPAGSPLPETFASPASGNMSRPPSQPGMYVAPTSMGPGTPPTPEMFAPPAQRNMGRPPSQPGMGGAQPPQMSGNWRGQQSQGNYQAPPPAQARQIAPGQPDRSAVPVRQGGVTPPVSQPAAAEIHAFVRPLPRWAVASACGVGALLLAGLIFVNADWATGATIAAMVAVILVILLGIATGVRVALGLLKETNPRRRSQIISTALLAVLLLLFSGLGMSQQSSLHLVQGRYLESHQSWSAAITEYQAAGEKSSSSVDVARTYDEWGNAQIQQQDYAGAVTSFTAVIKNYQQATNEFNLARTRLITAYLAWADQASQQQNYAGATAHYNALLSLVFCDPTSCMQLAMPKNATAYYHLAEQQLVQHQYVQAVDAYQTLTNRFPKAPETSQIHAHYAQALWGKGQQLLNNSCADALSAYRLLAKLFADTAEGKQAATALVKPVQVKGHFTQSVPGSPYHPTAYLVQGLAVGIQQYQFPPLLAHAPSATIHSDGNFTFTSVPQGTYELVWSSDNSLHFYYAYSGKHVLYVAHPGQLCAYNYGDVNQAIPAK